MSCTTTDQTISLPRGEDTPIPFYSKPEKSIADWTLEFVVAKDEGQPVLITRSSGDGIEPDDEAAGTFTVTIPRAATASLIDGKHRWELWRTDSGSVTLLASGPLVVRESVRSAS